MYNAKKRLRLSSITTVEELIKVLETYNPKAKVMVDGYNYFYIHSKKGGRAISFDHSSLDEEYIMWGNYDDLPEVRNRE